MTIPSLPYYDIEALQQPLSNKVDWQLDPNRCVLLIHDMQQYFLDFYGKDSAVVETLVANIERLKKQCKTLNIPVVYTAQPEDQTPEDRALLTDFWGAGLKSGGQNAHIVSALAPEPDDVTLTKWRYSAFQRSDLKQRMTDAKRDQLLVCGVYAHIGILTTCLEAFMTDIQSFVVMDAVADFSQEEHLNAMAFIAGRCGKIESLASLTHSLSVGSAKNSLSLAELKRDIATSLRIPVSDIEDDENLVDLGLDSVRLMSLLEQWRQKGANVSFADLAETSELQVWWEMLNATMHPTTTNAI